ncbi:acetyltransferase [Oxalobacteraceae bacterium R-40]|uniref:Acetyltransferase n=1 Tax=Keguizhuia sedimenti TaxID=3064264 RepID=A0ABU1BP90_9BURK|nr:acetyltransferase [Oxalobacteraceae bacterium R-40]
MKRLAILGASGHGKVVADTALASGWQSISFFDDCYPAKTQNGRWPIVGSSQELVDQYRAFDGVVVAIGDNAARWKKFCELRNAGATMATIVHPHAWISPHAKLGAGTIIVAGAIVNIDAYIGEACIINTGATIDHDCVLGNAIHVSPGANLSGNVAIKDGSWIGAGSCIRQGIVIGADVTVGCGSVVVKPVENGKTVAGCPASEL